MIKNKLIIVLATFAGILLLIFYTFSICIITYQYLLFQLTGFDPNNARIDTCLDNGGRWNKVYERCEFK